MSKLKKISLISVATAALLSMSGCSENKGGEATPFDNLEGGTTSSENSQNENSITLRGKVVDGYIRDADVCLDLNANNQCDAAIEPTTTTSSDGDYTLTITPEQKQHENISSAAIIAYGGIDNDTQKPFVGLLSAPFDLNTTEGISQTVTAISSLIVALTKEGEESARASVAKLFGVSESDLDKDPLVEAKNGNSKLLSATLQLQKSVEILVSATQESSSSTNATKTFHNIVKSLAVALKQKSSSASSLTALIEEAATDESAKVFMPPAAIQARGAALIMAKNVASIFSDAGSSDDALLAASLTLEETKESFVQEIASMSFSNSTTLLDFSNSSVIKEDAYVTHTVEISEIDNTLIGNMLQASGVKNPTAAMIDAVKKESNFDPKTATHKEFSKVVSDSKDPALSSVKSKVENFSKGVENGNSNNEATKEVLSNFDTVYNTTSVANADDAKRLVEHIRDLGAAFYEETPLGDDVNASSALGKHAEYLQDRVKPAVEDLAEKIKSNLDDIATLTENFGSDFDQDFKKPIDSIRDRLKEIQEQFDAHEVDDNANEESWSETTTFGDVITWSRQESGSDVNMSLSITNENGTDINGSVAIVNDGDNELKSILFTPHSTSQIFKDKSQYKLNVTSLALNISNYSGTLSLQASGTIDGANSAKMDLKKLQISSSVDLNIQNPNAAQDIELAFDGQIDVGGRSLEGQLIISESDSTKNRFHGKLSGRSGEAVIEGSVQADLQLDDLKDAWADNLKAFNANGYSEDYGRDYAQDDGYHYYWENDNSLAIVTAPDGKKYLSFDGDYNKMNDDYDTVNRKFKKILSSGETLSCDLNSSRNHYNDTYTKSINCVDSQGKGGYLLEKIYANYIVDVTLSDGTKGSVIDAYNSYYYLGDPGVKIETEDNEHIDVDLSGGGVTITDVSVRKAKLFADLSGRVSADVNVTQGDVRLQIAAVVDATSSDGTVTISANSVELSDTDNLIQADKLSLSFDKEAFTSRGIVSAPLDGSEYKYEDKRDFSMYNSIVVSNLQLNVKDSNKSSLDLAANISITQDESENIAITFDGSYSYLGTKLDGHIATHSKLVESYVEKSKNYYQCSEEYIYQDFKGSEDVNETSYSHNTISSYDQSGVENYSENRWKKTTCSPAIATWSERDTHIEGDVTLRATLTPADDFEPFTLEGVASFSKESIDSKLLFIQGDYQLALQLEGRDLDSENEKNRVTISDSYGVKSTIEKNGDTDVKSVVIKNIKDKTLATFGEKENGNKWEVVYEDKTSESIF